jgi:hypothetical protein
MSFGEIDLQIAVGSKRWRDGSVRSMQVRTAKKASGSLAAGVIFTHFPLGGPLKIGMVTG